MTCKLLIRTLCKCSFYISLTNNINQVIDKNLSIHVYYLVLNAKCGGPSCSVKRGEMLESSPINYGYCMWLFIISLKVQQFYRLD